MTRRFSFFFKTVLSVLAGFLFLEAHAGTDDPLVSLRARRISLPEVLARLEAQADVTFSYEASLLENMPAASVDFRRVPFTKCLESLCSVFPIRYEREGRFVILKRKKLERITVSGFVRDAISGEALAGASVYAARQKRGTAANEHGFFSLTLDGADDIAVSYIGYAPCTLRADCLRRDTALTVRLHPNQHLAEVVVDAFYTGKSLLRAPQMGKVGFSYDEIKRTPALFGEADIIKAVQVQTGVSPGMAGFSGMYVRGGNRDENLYLIEGNPVYGVSHAAGLFSAFNVEAVKDVDFYKAGFPARFGGRISGVMDVRMKDGNLKEFHGSATLGLTSGSLNLEGPVVRDKTSFSFNLRRTWMDVLTAPALAIWNASRKSGDSKTVVRYAFTDLNLKLTHHFSGRSRAFAGLYWGRDYLKGGTKEDYEGAKEEDISRLHWGSLTAFGGWAHAFSGRLYGTLNAFYTRYASEIRRDRESRGDDTFFYRSSMENGTDDAGFRADFNWRPASGHNVRFGGQYISHDFRPEYSEASSSAAGVFPVNGGQESLHAHEAGIYAEDEWKACPWFLASGGVRFSLYRADGKTYTNWEPRLNAVFLLNGRWSVKASYARMNQYIHQLNDSYIDLPTDTWISVDRRFKPLRSDQVSVGAYFSPNPAWSFSAEGFYKWMDNLLDYKDGYNIHAATADWNDLLTAGEGTAYGVELLARREKGKVTGTVSYTLSWNNRRFSEINGGNTFPAKFDNRHKLNITANWRVNKKVEINAAWTYMTGNRVTVSFDNYGELGRDRYEGGQFGYSPTTPGIQFPGSELVPPFYFIADGNGLSHYTARNNVRLPAYHRLDLGINIYKPLKKGRTGIWNVSLYNAYCYMAPVSIQKRYRWIGSRNLNAFQTLRLIPVIPSVSYTLKF